MSKVKCHMSPRGVILIELILAMGLLLVIGSVMTATFYGGQQAGRIAEKRVQSAQLAQEAIDAAKAVSEEDWNTLYNLNKGSANPYHPVVSGGKWTLTTATEDITLDGETYTRKVVIDNVSRDGSGNIESTYASANDDPGTQKITVTVTHTQSPDVVLVDYVTRFRNTTATQTDWSGGIATSTVTSFGTTYESSDSNVDVTGTAGSIKLNSQ